MELVECRACGNCVLVEKNSLAHTSVQWTSVAARACAEFASQVENGTNSARIPTCFRLRESIERAVADGVLSVLHL